MITSGCGLALEPRFFKEAGLSADASPSIDGGASADALASDGALIVQDRVVAEEDAVVISTDSGTTGDVTAVSDVIIEPVLDAARLDATPLDVINHADSGVATDTGVVDSGVATDTGVIDSGMRTDSGMLADSGRVDGSVFVDGGLRLDGGDDVVCSAGLLFCGGTCVANNESNCGACGRSCGDSRVCVRGMCTSCPAGQTVCGDLNGNRCCAPACGPVLVCVAGG